jgi:hypothetical protein
VLVLLTKSLLGTNGKPFEKILLTRILRESNGHGILRNQTFRFRTKHSTAQQLVRLVERVSRNVDDKWLTDAVFLHKSKAFDTVWVDGHHYKLIVFNVPSFLVKTISSCLHGQTFEASIQTGTFVVA